MVSIIQETAMTTPAKFRYAPLAVRLRRRRDELRARMLAPAALAGAVAAGDSDPHEVRDFKDLAADDMRALVSDAKLAAASRELQDVDAALHRIEHGTYGDCVECGEPIARCRLEALPATPCCTDCQALRERQRGLVYAAQPGLPSTLGRVSALQ
jgi:DnaK suppressor protein